MEKKVLPSGGGTMDFSTALGIEESNYGSCTGRHWYKDPRGEKISLISPVDGETLAAVFETTPEAYEKVVAKAQKAFAYWRRVPAPKRGEIVRQIGLKIREKKKSLGTLISYEMGKTLQEGMGEVQEMIDMCDFAVGQSRMLYGFNMHSERAQHRMYEQYHPLGIVGIVTAFNFPVAVWSWNAMIASVCGDVTLWKPSSQVPLTAIATQKIIAKVVEENDLPEGIFSLVIGKGSTIGEKMLEDRRLPLVSFTGSVSTGRHAAEVVSRRLGRTLLELSGNNAIIITDNADLELALSAVVFGALGTAGQRCTTTRRLILHRDIYDQVKEALLKAYQSVRIGNPLDEANHMGPMISKKAVKTYLEALKQAREEGGHILYGGAVLTGKGYESGCYVTPALVESENHHSLVQREIFGPLLHLIKYEGPLRDAIAIQNDVTQGLSSAIFTRHLGEAEIFLSSEGSDCGIANVNIGTSGAEIGGAFGGEKETGGGREAGSDAWKAYMRRQTVTINYGSELPLAQGIRFLIGT